MTQFDKKKLDAMQVLDEHTKLPIFQKFFRDSEKSTNTYRIHAYVTYDKRCSCNCSFCRNKQFSNDIKVSNADNMLRSLKRFSPYIHSITFGGGEPLLFIDDLIKTMQDVYYNENGQKLHDAPTRYMITSGLREQFIENILKIFCYFDRIYLTRQRKSDKDNQRAFNTKVPILTTRDLRKLGSFYKGRIEIVSTCYKNGGIDNLKEVIELIKWTTDIGIRTIIFNDLQFDVTDPHYYEEHQINDDLFEDAIKFLKSQGFREKIEVCFSGGYTIRMYEGSITTKRLFRNPIRSYINVGFKQYHKPGTTLDIWQRTSKRTFDLSIMPNGEVFTDWANKKSTNNI